MQAAEDMHVRVIFAPGSRSMWPQQPSHVREESISSMIRVCSPVADVSTVKRGVVCDNCIGESPTALKGRRDGSVAELPARIPHASKGNIHNTGWLAESRHPQCPINRHHASKRAALNSLAPVISPARTAMPPLR